MAGLALRRRASVCALVVLAVATAGLPAAAATDRADSTASVEPTAGPGAVLSEALADQVDAGLVTKTPDGRRTVKGEEVRAAFASLVDPEPGDQVEGALLVTTVESADAAGLVRAFSGRAGAKLTAVTDRVVRVDVAPSELAATAAALRGRADVVAVEPVVLRGRAAAPNDAKYPQQWAHQLADAERAWDVTTGTPSVAIAVIDSGVVGTHPDLQANLAEQWNLSSGVQPVALRSDNERCPGDTSHGTAVAGVAAADGNNGLEIAGVAWRARIIDIAVFRAQGSGCLVGDDRVIAAIGHAVDRGARIINLSLGGPGTSCPTAMQTAITNARNAGAVVIAAAGNDQEWRPSTHSVPASCNGVISVGATGRAGQIAGYSQVNNQVDLVAPGGDSTADGIGGLMLSLDGTGGTKGWEGTSFAAPYVAGAAALLRSAHPDLTPDQVESLLERTALDLGPAGRDDRYGWGLVQVGAAVADAAKAKQSGTQVPAPAPDPSFPVGGGSGGITLPPPAPEVFRVAPASATRPAVQAVAVSDAVFFDRGATHAVIARDDDYADALGGSALGFGFGPLLFTARTGPLDRATRAELVRVLEPGSPVFLLGGGNALPETLEGEIRALGFRPFRLSGKTRESTAVVVGQATDRLVGELGYAPIPVTVLATRGKWPDAVAAGSIAAYFGLPILLTPPDELHDASAKELARRRPVALYVIGGGAAVSDRALEQARQAAGLRAVDVVRLAGRERVETAVAVADELEGIFADAFNTAPTFAIATNMRRADGYAHVLSASVIAGAFGAVFIPVEGEGGDNLTGAAREYVRGFGIDGVMAGGTDLLSPAVESQLRTLLRE